MEVPFPQGESKNHNPNHIPPNERKWNIILSIVLILIGSMALMADDLPITGRGFGRWSSGHSSTVHFHGETLWLFFGAVICASANMMSVVVDHYDKRNNEINYKRFARTTEALGWALLWAAFLLEAIVYQKAVVVH